MPSCDVPHVLQWLPPPSPPPPLLPQKTKKNPIHLSFTFTRFTNNLTGSLATLLHAHACVRIRAHTKELVCPILDAHAHTHTYIHTHTHSHTQTNKIALCYTEPYLLKGALMWSMEATTCTPGTRASMLRMFWVFSPLSMPPSILCTTTYKSSRPDTTRKNICTSASLIIWNYHTLRVPDQNGLSVL